MDFIEGKTLRNEGQGCLGNLQEGMQWIRKRGRRKKADVGQR